MIHKIKNKAIRVVQKIKGSMAFIPGILIFCFLFAAIFFVYLESKPFGIKYSEHLDPYLIKNVDTARAIISTIIAGVFSLVVFSFSMVMLILNQASNNFSPRLLPGLISNKLHQLILGFFMGTIVFGLLVMINIQPESRAYKAPSIAIFITLILSISCLILFVYFLHSISQAIQIDHILKRVYTDTSNQLKKAVEKKSWSKSSDSSQNWYKIEIDNKGYIHSINEKDLLKLAVENESSIQVAVTNDRFVDNGNNLTILTEKKLEAEQQDAILSCIQIEIKQEVIADFNTGFKQITEVIMRAMSPGINDSGTAGIGIDYLKHLFLLRLDLPNEEVLSDNESTIMVSIRHSSFESLIYEVMSNIRTYLKHDIQMVLRLIGMLQTLLGKSNLSADREKIIQQELDVLIEDANTTIKNKRDLDIIKKAIK